MHILITGGTGFIGQELAAHLLRDSHTVTVLTRDPAQARIKLPPGTNAVDDLAPLEGVGAVVNLAGENLGAGRWNPQRKALFRASRLSTTRRLVEWMTTLSVRPAVLVSGSAIGYYGPRGDEVITSDAGPGEDFSATLCKDWEAEAMKAEALGVRVCRLRTGIVLGRSRNGQVAGALAQMLPPFKLGAGGPMGNGRQWMSWIHLSDEVALIRWLIDTPNVQGAYNGTAPHPVTNAEFAAALGQAVHRPARLPMPGFMLKLIVGEMAEILLTGQKVIPKRSLDQGFVFQYPKLDAALRDVLS